MGRVSRYRKIRRDDPFSKHPKEIDPTINQPVDKKKENRLSVSMKRFIALKKKAELIEKGERSKKNKKNNNDNSIESTKKGNNNKSQNDNNDNTKQQKNKIEMKEGENFYEFQRRLNQETKKVLIEEAKKTKRQKRNAYFEAKKLKKKLKKKNDDDDDIPSFDKLVDHVKFGEVADRPPKLTTLPRGAVPKSKKIINVNIQPNT